jgi:hypothetical protein
LINLWKALKPEQHFSKAKDHEEVYIMFGLPHSCTRRRASPGMEAPSQTSPCKLGKWIGTIFVSKMMDPPPILFEKN